MQCITAETLRGVACYKQQDAHTMLALMISIDDSEKQPAMIAIASFICKWHHR